MKYSLLVAAALLTSTAPALAATVSVITDPNAPVGNFQAATNRALAGYDITMSSNGTHVVGKFVQTGGTRQDMFANLYFDLNPSTGTGSNLGFEINGNGVTAFIPGKNGQPGFNTVIDPSLYTFASQIDGNGLATIDLSLHRSLFRGPIGNLAYYPGAFENRVRLRLSQTFSYSVAGGPDFGRNLGTVGVPEPATWAMMLGGFGMLGGALRRRTSRTAIA